jgi:hypothetical protein
MKNLLLCLLFFIMSLTHFNSTAASHQGKVNRINMYGGEYSNGWRGSILYRIDRMPSGVSYFYVKKDDIAFQTFLSALLSAKHAKAVLTIHYDETKIDGNGYVNTLIIVQE